MQKNTFLAFLLSAIFLFVWMTYFQPKQSNQATSQQPAEKAESKSQLQQSPEYTQESSKPPAKAIAGKEFVVESPKYKAVFTTNGAAIKHWYIKEKNGALIDLVLEQNTAQLSTFPGSKYELFQPEPKKLVFSFTSLLGWKITKTYELSENYLHKLSVQITKTKASAVQPGLQIDWGPGIGTDLKEQKENAGLIRALGYKPVKPSRLNKFKPGDYSLDDLKWVAIDNRYFLCAFIPAATGQFDTVSVYRASKKQPLGLALSANKPQNNQIQSYSIDFYLGPKGHTNLKKLGLNLEESIDFGIFGFLGKLALDSLGAFYKLTGNYGWAIIFLTIIIQILVLPLTIKSFKASAAMKFLQPQIKLLQKKYKSDPKRLNVEMLNLYKTQKVNPLGGCLPMILQLPIFWALFTTLRNAYELRGAQWIFWIKDLSAPDTLMHLGPLPLNVLPLIMGAGMFFQQKMMSVSTDPTQTQIMYLMPIIFTFMFWGFPSGLVIYWLTNSILTMIEQYYILKGQKTTQFSHQ